MKFNIWSDFSSSPLPDLLSFIVDNRGKSVPTVNREGACDNVLIATNCIRNDRLYPAYEKVRYISEEIYSNWFRAHPIAGDIIFVNKGTPGRVCLCPNKIDFCIAQDMMAFRVNSEKVYNKYLLAVLRSRVIQEQIRNTSVGDTIPHFKKEFLKELFIPTPPMEIQQIIGDYYFILSDKIELNKGINENLEQQAQAIFKSWFVDFEPFGGVMPWDWKIGTFSDIIQSTLGGDWGKEEATGNYTEQVYCIRGADIPEVKAGNKGKLPIRYILPKNYNSKKLVPDDIVIEISGGSPTQSTGRAAAISQSLLDRYVRGMICTNFCRAIKPMAGYSKFVYYYWQYLYDRNVFFSYENGTTGIKNLDLTGFLETESIVIPSVDVLNNFNMLSSTIFSQIFENGLENERLAALRDALLPKLMNGEIDVSEVKF